MSTEPRPHLNQDGNEKFVAIPTSGLPATQPTSYPNFDFLKNLPFEYLSGQALLAHPDAGLYHKIYWKTIDAEGEEEDPQVIAAEEGFESGTYLWARKPLEDGGDIIFIAGQEYKWFIGDAYRKANKGYIYNIYATLDVRGIAPDGYHVATASEYEHLIETLDALEVTDKIKTADDWGLYGGTNESGFTAKPTGYRDYDGTFSEFDSELTYFITPTLHSPNNYTTYSLVYNVDELTAEYKLNTFGGSVRCCKTLDYTYNSDEKAYDADGNEYDTIAIGELVWLVQNLMTTHYNNGDEIVLKENTGLWASAGEGAYCAFDNDDASVWDEYGDSYEVENLEKVNIIARQGIRHRVTKYGDSVQVVLTLEDDVRIPVSVWVTPPVDEVVEDYPEEPTDGYRILNTTTQKVYDYDEGLDEWVLDMQTDELFDGLSVLAYTSPTGDNRIYTYIDHEWQDNGASDEFDDDKLLSQHTTVEDVKYRLARPVFDADIRDVYSSGLWSVKEDSVINIPDLGEGTAGRATMALVAIDKDNATATYHRLNTNEVFVSVKAAGVWGDWEGVGGGGAFTDLTDTFADYTDREGQVIVVNDEADGLDSVETVALPALGEDEVWVGDGSGGVTTMAIDDIGGEPITPVDGILDWDTNVYKPYTSKQSSLLHFYTGTTNPDGTTRLNVDAVLAATQLIVTGVVTEVTNTAKYVHYMRDYNGNYLFQSHTHNWNNGVFYQAYGNAFGLYSGNNNTGYHQSAFGHGSGAENTGEHQSTFGSGSGGGNSGDYQSAFGYVTGSQNKGDYQSAFGYYAGYRNNWANRTIIGAQLTYWQDDATTTKAFDQDDINTSTSLWTITSHGFGANGSFVFLRYNKTSGTNPEGYGDMGIYEFEIIDSSTLKRSVSGSFTGEYTLTKDVDRTNSTALGYNAVATKANQVMLGDANITEVYSAGLYKGAGIQLNDLQTAPSSASDTGTKGEVRIAAGAIYVCTDTDTWVKATLATW